MEIFVLSYKTPKTTNKGHNITIGQHLRYDDSQRHLKDIILKTDHKANNLNFY